MAWNEVESGGAWKPTEVGAKLEGTLKAKESREGKNGKDYTQFVIETESGDTYNVSGAVLESKLSELEIGSRVLLTYKGEQSSKNGKYKDFSVAVWEDDKPGF
ncbi:MAG TPA: hypothetical protein VKR52_04510 [Terracidiphilus sp.]|nr:hypothetical protein [Terracidiphilus sp.]